MSAIRKTLTIIMYAMSATQNNQNPKATLERKQSLTSKLLNEVAQTIDVRALSRELGKSSSEAMKIVLSVITDMLERNERHIVSNGVEVTLRKRKVKGIGKEIAFDVWCNKYLYVGGVWL